MNKFLIFILASIPMLAVAADQGPLKAADSLCKATIQHRPDGDVKLWQHQFEDGAFDLAIAKFISGEPGHITRLSFKGSKDATCHFPAFALMPGGDWGWHVAWSSSSRPGVYYARVDGEAWVSSLPKKTSDSTSESVELEQKDGVLMLKYLHPKYPDHPRPAAESNEESVLSTLISSDEGRNWDRLPD